MSPAEIAEAKAELRALGYAEPVPVKRPTIDPQCAAVAKRRAKLKAAGLCQSCGWRKAHDGLPLCAPCGIARRVRARNYGGCKARKDEGRGKPTVYPGEK